MKNNKEKIKNYILEHISRSDKGFATRAADAFGISRSTVYNYIGELLESGCIEKTSGVFPYALVSEEREFRYDNRLRLEEDRIFRSDFYPLISGLNENVIRIWSYAFTEMMNNAIEHSEADTIFCKIVMTCLDTSVYIDDNGMGIFNNIQKFIKAETGDDILPDDCAALLLAGKFTTKKESHSGEGIFFTSHVMDVFAIASGGNFYARSGFSDTVFKNGVFDEGTMVCMKLSNLSKKELKGVFNSFSDENGVFSRTQIPIAHMFPSGFPVSRSEARRLLGVIGKFREARLDFSGIEEIGQAFAHELFAVGGVTGGAELKIENANESVSAMIKRVKESGIR